MLLERLKEIRTYHGLKQKEVAEILGVSRTTYCCWENQYGIIPLTKLNTFCNYFQVSMDYICGLTDISTKKINFIELDKQIIGSNLKQIRNEHDHSQRFIGKILKMQHSHYSQYERGKFLITTPLIISFAKYYNISIDWICGKTTERSLENKKDIN